MLVMSRSSTQKFIGLMLLVFAGQTFAMPFLDCCATNSDTVTDTLAMDADHDMEMPTHHHSEMTTHTDESLCNHQCDVCMGTVLLAEYTAFTALPAPKHVNEIYHFILPVSSTDNPFRPPIFA